MKKLPERINYAELYLTFRCNLNCSYCINEKGDIQRKRKEISAEEWAVALNRINFNDLALTMGGGEPTLHKEFYQLLDKLKPEIEVDLLTNLQVNPYEFCEKTDPKRFNRIDKPAYRSIRVSYHAEKMDPEELIKKAKILQDAGFSIGIFGLNHPNNLEANMAMSEFARRDQIYFFIKDFLGEYNGKLFGNYAYPEGLDGKLKKAKCRSNELLVAPDGNVYRCHRDLYNNQNRLGSILDEHFELDEKFRECDCYGKCNPCDVKLKTNRFLQAGNCQVEIIPEKND